MPTAFTARGSAYADISFADRFLHIGATPMYRILQSAPATVEYQIVSLRQPQYGIPLEQRHTFLQTLLPSGVDRYVGLFATMADHAGVDGIEVTGANYARIAHNNWRRQTIGGYIARRANIGEVRFAAFSAERIVAGWGIWDALTGGNLVAFGLMRTSSLTARVMTIASGESPVFGDSLLRVGIQ